MCMKRCLTSVTFLLLCLFRADANVLLDEPFSYPNGNLVGAAGSTWLAHSGAGTTPVAVNAGRAAFVGGTGSREDISILIPGQPFTTGGATPTLYASFVLNCSSLPNEVGTYFAHFQRSTNIFRARIWASTTGAAPGTYRLSIGNAAGSATTGQLAQDLSPDANYRVVIRYSVATGASTLWVNPASEASPGVAAEDVPVLTQIERFGFRQGFSGTDGSSGTMQVDNLLVGSEFSDVQVADLPPTISTIAPQQIVANGSTGPLNFTIGDDQTPVGSLALTAGSANQTLVPLAGIVLGGSGANRTVTVTPAPNQTGTALITVTVSDGLSQTPTSFQITVIDNLPPSITAISDQQLLVNSSTGPLAFTVGDNLVAAGDLILDRDSNNQTLVPLTGIVFGGSGANRTVTVTPATNQEGTATITITVSDGANSTPTTFQVTVVNDLPPSISSIADREISLNTGTGPIPFTVGDDLTDPGDLSLSKGSDNLVLVPLAGIVFGGTGANRTVTVTPAANQIGVANITITVGDGANFTPTSFQLTVVDDQPPTISSIGNQQVVVNGNTGPLALTVGDNLVPAANLTLDGDSDNLTLVPLAGIVFGGSGGNRTVTVTPAAGQQGTANITVFVSDGGNFTPTSFLVTVVTDLPPTITAISDQSIFVNTSTGPVAFTIGDDLTPAGNLTLSRNSDNQTLVPLNGIVFGGSGASRTVTVTPAANRVGTALITVSVSDGTSITPEAFSVTVTDNQPPSISAIPDQTLAANSTTGPVSFTVSDGVVPAASLTLARDSDNLTLVPLNNIVFGGSGSSRTVTVTPAASQQGSARITVTVSDGANPANRSFLVTVGVPAIAPVVNQFTPVSTALGPLPVVVSHGALDPGLLTLTATSSNDGVIADASLVLGGSGAQRTLIATPVAGQTGVTTITLTAGDGVQSVQQTFTITVHPNPGVLVTDNFSRSEEGPVVDNDLWWNHGGTPFQTLVLLDQLFLSQTQSEDFHRRLHPAVNYAPGAGNVFYAGFIVNFSALPNGSGSYFSHFNTNSFRARLFARTNFAAAGQFRVGIANATVNPPNDAFLARDLALNRDYQVVVRYSVGTGESRLWIDPVTMFDPSVAATDTPQPITIDTFAFRQSDPGNPLGMGVLTVDDLKVASSFSAVLSLVPVNLGFSRNGSTLRLSWPTGDGYLLRRTSGLPAGSWNNVPFTVASPDDFADINIATGGGIFRLEKAE